MGFFWKRANPHDELIKVIIQGENERRQAQVQVDLQRVQLEQFKIAQEYEHLEALADQRRKDADERERLKQQRREWFAKARENKAAKAAAAARGGGAGSTPATSGGCRVCANQGDPTLTSAEIVWHHNGHRAAS